MTDATASRYLGCTVDLIVSEPWELSKNLGENNLTGVIAAIRGIERESEREVAVIDLATPATWGSSSYGSLLIQARHGNHLVDRFALGPVECNFIGLKEDEIGQDFESWRGGCAGIGTLVVTAST